MPKPTHTTPEKSSPVRPTPANIEVERAVIGGILLDPAVMADLSAALTEADFFGHVNRRVWSACFALWSAGKPIDILTLAAELDRTGWLEKMGGNAALIEINDAAVSAAGLMHHAATLKALSVRRRIIMAANTAIEESFTHTGEISELADRIGGLMLDIVRPESQRRLAPLRAGIAEAVKHLDRISKHGWLGIPTGHTDLDNLTGGMQKGDLIVLAARPSMGKTALALGIALQAAKASHRVRIISLEMSLQQLALRLLSMEAGVSLQSLSRSGLGATGWAKVTAADDKIANLPIMIDDSGATTIQSVRHDCRRAALDKSSGLDILIVDYLGLLSTSERFDNREQTVASMTRGLKLLAKELNIPILLVSQLNRAAETRLDKRPHLSDLRESGAIEQDADMVWMIYRDEVYNANTTDKGMAEIHISKNRNGPVGMVKMQFDAQSATFKNLHRSAKNEADAAY